MGIGRSRTTRTKEHCLSIVYTQCVVSEGLGSETRDDQFRLISCHYILSCPAISVREGKGLDSIERSDASSAFTPCLCSHQMLRSYNPEDNLDV